MKIHRSGKDRTPAFPFLPVLIVAICLLAPIASGSAETATEAGTTHSPPEHSLLHITSIEGPVSGIPSLRLFVFSQEEGVRVSQNAHSLCTPGGKVCTENGFVRSTTGEYWMLIVHTVRGETVVYRFRTPAP